MTKQTGHSRLQNAQCLHNLANINASNKDNIGNSALESSHSVPISELNAVNLELSVEQMRSNDYARRYRNARKQTNRALASKAQLQDQLTSAKAESIALQSNAAFTRTKLETVIEEMEESNSSKTSELNSQLLDANGTLAHTQERNSVLQQRVDKLRMRSARAAESKSKAVQNALSKAQISATTYQLKQKGTVVNDARSLSWDLVQLGVPVAKVNDAIHRVSRTVGVTVLGDISNRTVRRTVLEGGVASEIQIADELRQTGGKS
jgi:chromosome segregation ATPase